MIVETSYNTSTLQGLNNDKLEDALRKLLIKRNKQLESLGVVSGDEYKVGFITGWHPEENDVPAFNHPYLLEVGKDEKYLFVNVRGLVSREKETDDITNLDSFVKNKNEFLFAKTRLIYNLAWLENGRAAFSQMDAYSMVVYAHLLTGFLFRIYNLDFTEMLKVRIAIAYYYKSLGFEYIDSEIYQMNMFNISKHILYPSEFVNDFKDKMLINPRGLGDLVENIKRVMDSTKLDRLDINVLANAISRSWYGNNGYEITLVGLEHPPTWYSVLTTVLENKSYKHSPVAVTAEKKLKKNQVKELLTSHKYLLNDYEG